MQTRTLGPSGLKVSSVGLGCNNFGGRLDVEATRRVVDKAFDLGITLFDTADMYGNGGGSETCLGRLLGEWIDLYQLHRPDPLTPLEETLRAFDDLVHQGKVRDIERELIPAIDAYGLGLLPFFPLASGMLTGKYRKGSPVPQGTRLAGTKGLADRFLTDANLDTVERLERVAAERGHTLIELAFGWLLSHRAIPSVMAGATKPEQLDANVKAAGWQLTPEDFAAVDRACSGQ